MSSSSEDCINAVLLSQALARVVPHELIDNIDGMNAVAPDCIAILYAVGDVMALAGTLQTRRAWWGLNRHHRTF